MSWKKRILVGGLLVSTSLIAKDVTTILPYYATMNYDNSTAHSDKDNGTISGIYVSRGNLNYLLEVDYAKTDIKYKSSTGNSNLKQDGTTLIYSKYYPKYMLKGGIHHISTTDTDLGDGDTIIFSIGGYKWKGYDKYSYGLENYYTKFKDGHDENSIAKAINIIQLSPYYSFL